MIRSTIAWVLPSNSACRRGWSVTIVQLHAKAQETMEMIPVHPEFVARAQAEHKFLFKAETQIPFMNLDTMESGTPRSTNRRNPSPPPSPPADAQAREVFAGISLNLHPHPNC